jgi:hypothetical protein
MLLANKRDVPYQSLIKIFLQEGIDEELRLKSPVRLIRQSGRRP